MNIADLELVTDMIKIIGIGLLCIFVGVMIILFWGGKR